jgi:hypothetical protein
MGLWRLVKNLWALGRAKHGRDSTIRRLPAPTTFTDPDECEDRTARTALYYAAPEPEGVRIAEVIRVAAQQQARQQSGTDSKFHRLSVIVVDYLLEHEWFYLLTGYRGAYTEPQWSDPQSSRYITASNSYASAGEPGSTICVSDTDWSVASTNMPPSPPDPPTNEAE